MSAENCATWTIAAALQYGRNQLKELSPSADLDAQLLLCFALSVSRLQLVVDAKQEVSPSKLELFLNLIERRKNLEPVAYITGKKEFWGLDFEVNPSVLIPRPDTELLLEMALTVSAEFKDPILALDLGTGSGCIAVALSHELRRRNRNFFMLACDRSLKALEVASRNAKNNNLSDKINFLCSDWSSAIGQDFDLILSNPPYLIEGDLENSNELKFEPESALYAGGQGLDDYRKIFADLPGLLSSQGVFLGEIGYGQADLIEKLAIEMLPQPEINFHFDLRRIQRVVEIRLKRYF